MVAAAGTTSALNPAGALLGLGVALLVIVAWVLLADRVQITNIVPMPNGDSMILIAMPVALACYGFYISRGGEPLLGRRILD
jgi:hypothetical protein